MANTLPSNPADTGHDTNFGYPSGPLGPDAQMNMIGGTHHMSTKIDPHTALRGGYQAINGDSMPAGAPVDGNPAYVGPYLPKN